MTTLLFLKQAIRERDGFRCQKCGISEKELGRGLDVHRIVPGSEYSLSRKKCISLCTSCHRKMERRVRRPPGQSPMSKIIRAAILKTGKSAYAAAKGSRTDPGTVRRFMTGRLNLSFGVMEKLCDYLGLELKPKGLKK